MSIRQCFPSNVSKVYIDCSERNNFFAEMKFLERKRAFVSIIINFYTSKNTFSNKRI